MRSLWLITFLLIGCEGCGSDSENGAGDDNGEETTGGAETAEGDAPAVDEGPPPVLRIVGEPDRDGLVQITVENRGSEPARLRTAISIERQDGDWEAIGADVALRYSCETPAEECVTLVPGAALHPPAWRGELGDAQCDCERCTDAPAGEYRLVVTSCGGTHRSESAPFTLAR